MPYIKEIQRTSIDLLLDPLLNTTISEGELNYIITRILDTWQGKTGYSKINAVVGILECAKLEFYREIASNYEDYKAEINGKVYTGKGINYV